MSERTSTAISVTDRTIWKFVVSPYDRTEMPCGARILHVGAQGEDVCVWALVNPHVITEHRKIDAYGTGHPVPLDPGRFLGTVQMDNGLVFHLFDGDENGSPTTCGERWEDPFGEMNECGKPLGHGGPHLATWAMRLDAKNGSDRPGGAS